MVTEAAVLGISIALGALLIGEALGRAITMAGQAHAEALNRVADALGGYESDDGEEDTIDEPDAAQNSGEADPSVPAVVVDIRRAAAAKEA